MHILVTDPSIARQSQFKKQLSAYDKAITCHCVCELTQTYHYAEHHRPECVIINAIFAERPEFELLSSLLKIMGIGCVLIWANHQHANTVPNLNAKNHIVHISGNPGVEDLQQAIQRAIAKKPSQSKATTRNSNTTEYDPRRIILIGASTGGIDALVKTIAHFSVQCPATLIVQHTGGRFAKSLIRLLNGATKANVQEARNGATVAPGHIYLSPGDHVHLCLSQHQPLQIMLQDTPLQSGHRPSIDALFQSAIPHAGSVTAALLTGMGQDGAQGLLALRRAGAHTIGQDKATSVVYGMPRVAYDLGAVADQLPIEKIGPALLRASQKTMRA